MAKGSLKTWKDFAKTGRDMAYIARTVVVLKDHILGPAAEIIQVWVENVQAGRELTDDQETTLREKIEDMDEEDRATLLKLLEEKRP